jgi:DNA-binding MarR family transcriptional regulator
MPPSPALITQKHYELLAELRHALRQFLNFSAEAARDSGLVPQQHQALLAIKGFAGRDYVSVGELAERLQLRHHSAVGLVDRLVARGLLRRSSSPDDRRRLELRLTRKADALLARLSVAHLRELRQLGPELHRLIGSITREEKKRPEKKGPEKRKAGKKKSGNGK